jgi:hypothetical protein
MSDPPNPPGRRKSFSDRKAVKSEVFERKSLKFWVPTHRVPAVIEIVKVSVTAGGGHMVHARCRSGFKAAPAHQPRRRNSSLCGGGG